MAAFHCFIGSFYFLSLKAEKVLYVQGMYKLPDLHYSKGPLQALGLL